LEFRRVLFRSWFWFSVLGSQFFVLGSKFFVLVLVFSSWFSVVRLQFVVFGSEFFDPAR